MGFRRSLLNQFDKLLRRSENRTRNRRDIDIVLGSALERAGRAGDLLFPVQYVEFLRQCIEDRQLRLKEARGGQGAGNGLAEKRFNSLLGALRRLPPVELQVAEEIGQVADSFRGDLRPSENVGWAGDIRAHFEISSSFGTKGRILTAIIRFSQSRQVLELGTGYGMSSLFILEALRRQSPEAHLTTVEGWEPQFSLSSKILNTRYGNQVSCEFGRVQEMLPGLVGHLRRLDFLFHDAGHSGADYVNDFQAALPVLAPGAVVLVDDIRFEDRRFSDTSLHCYEGWREIVNHPRVDRAVEIEGVMGLLLLGSDGANLPQKPVGEARGGRESSRHVSTHAC
jgi:predicted O-methyltransferase YrrM